MKKIIPILVLLILSCFANSQEKILNINKSIRSNPTNGSYGKIRITPEYFIIEIDPYGLCLYDEFTVENLIPVKVEGYELGTKSDKNFWVYVPRQYKKLYIRGINHFGQDTMLDLTPYEVYVKARTGRKGLDDSEKPKVYLNYPKLTNNFYRTEELFITIEGEVSDNLGILNLKLNDVLLAIHNGKFKKRVKLEIGKNSILLKATDINNNIAFKDFVIIRDELIIEDSFSDVDFVNKTANTNSKAIAVVFGIEVYRNAPSVTHAVNDADIFREYLIKKFGLLRKNIFLRLNEQATKGEFDKVFSENGWIAKNADKNSEIYVFYAGHGVASTEDGSAYLIPNDIDPNYASTGYSLNELYQNLSKIKSKSTIIILDACFSGVSRENEMLLADSRPISIEVKQGSIPKNINVFTASSGNEISSGYSQKKHGLFTYFFLKGLNKNADINNDKKITLGEMENYLQQEVSSQAKKMGREQNPQLHTSDKNKVLLKY
ncbi:MAG: caspase family protein [Candidatus Cloacimonetes bacterium]|nr:caspase family protein [Candidatus Cloacimonadota bacterium]